MDLTTAALSRRRFLVWSGLVAAASSAPGLLAPPRAMAAPADEVLGPALAQVARPLLQALAQDTIAGLVAWTVPGEDPYSAAQGTTRPLGGVQAQGPAFLLTALDEFLPAPDTALQALAQSLLTGVSDVEVPADVLGQVLAAPLEVTATLDQALLALFENDQTVPVSGLVALLVNWCATSAHPDAAAAGPFLSPFANLSYDQKFDAWQVLEEQTAEVLAAIDSSMSEPLRHSLSGLVRFVAGALVEFAAFGSFSEWHAFDRQSQRVHERPVGWQMSTYLPQRLTPADGWAAFRGYYRGVRAVEGSWDRTGTAPGTGGGR